MADNINDNFCRNDQNVTTLEDLKKRRQELLKKKKLILQKKLTDHSTMNIDNELQIPRVSSNLQSENITELCDDALEITSSAEFLANCETTTFVISNSESPTDIHDDDVEKNSIGISSENLPPSVSKIGVGSDLDIILDYSSDDSVADPNYVPLSEITNVEPIESTSAEGNDLFPERELEPEYSRASRTRKRKADQMSSKRMRNKKFRMFGQEYIGFRKNGDEKYLQDSIKPARKLGDTCGSVKCLRSKVINCEKFSETERLIIFNKFWQMSWEEKKMFVCSMIDAKPTKRKTTERTDSRRSSTKVYYLKLNDKKERVCLKTFIRTLGIKEWTVRYWLGERPSEKTNSNETRNDNLPTLKVMIKNFFEALPKLPSHYCRKSSTKLYLEPLIQSKRELYRLYVKNAISKSQKVASRKLFEDVFKEENIAIFKPKKDACDLCCSYKVGNVSEADYLRHISRKDLARKEKTLDKEAAKNGTVHVITADLQAVKLCPFLTASALYFKTKLMVHHFTVYNLGNDQVVCYWFDETATDLKASTYASMYVDYLTKVLDENPKYVIIYSDGCTSQNRNAVVSNAFLRLAIEKNIVITQKFLEKGHTQMEVDSVHSVIERKLKNREIFLPSQYASLTKEARLNPSPYNVEMPDYTFFKDFRQNLIYESIRPGRGIGAKCVVDVRVLKYSPDGTIEYKLNFNEEFQLIPRRPKRIEPVTPQQLFSAPLPISKSKYDHLQQLKEVVPKDCHEFYDKLPFKNG